MIKPSDSLPPWAAAHAKLNKARDKYGLAKQAYVDVLWSEKSCAWRAKRKIWRTTDGEEIPYSKMTDDHLVNAIASLSALRPENPALPFLKTEQERRKRVGPKQKEFSKADLEKDKWLASQINASAPW